MARHTNSPVRTCVGCRQRRPRTDLLRFHADRRGRLLPDPLGRGMGRGVYTCVKRECIDAAVKRSGFKMSLKRGGVAGVDTARLVREARERARIAASSLVKAGLEDGRARLSPQQGPEGQDIEVVEKKFGRRLAALRERIALGDL